MIWRDSFFLVSFSFSFLAMCIRIVIRRCFVAEAGGNWYLLILIYSLYKKYGTFLIFF
jgi:hypothetical protein